MVTKNERKFVQVMIWLMLWSTHMQMRIVHVQAKIGTRWLLKRLKERQVVDDLHHAPCCPANHYHKTRLVFAKCNCGAK